MEIHGKVYKFSIIYSAIGIFQFVFLISAFFLSFLPLYMQIVYGLTLFEFLTVITLNDLLNFFPLLSLETREK